MYTNYRKKPKSEPEVIEVNGIKDINKPVGNVDSNGNGLKKTTSDMRMGIASGVDQYRKDDAVVNSNLVANLWGKNDMFFLGGTIVFAGYNPNCNTNCGACSLTDEQVDICFDYIEKQKI